MAIKTIQARRPGAVTQFSVFTPNRLGRLYDLVGLLASQQVHVLALTVLETTESAIIRLVVDDPDRARELLHTNDFPFTESSVLGVELNATTDLNHLVAACLEAELNINYLYPFIPHPQGKSVLVLSMEDDEMAEKVLKKHQFRVLQQSDVSR